MKKYRMLIEIEFDFEGELTEEKVTASTERLTKDDVKVKFVNQHSQVTSSGKADVQDLMDITEMLTSIAKRGLN